VICRTPEDLKAWSQNLGHEKVLTTLTSYGEVECQRQGEIIHNLVMPQKTMQTDDNKMKEEVLEVLRRAGADV
jgi:hypothetical protein